MLAKPALSALLLSTVLCSCGTYRDFVELRAGERSFGEVWTAVDAVVRSDGFRPDGAVCDRGLGVYQTRWDKRVLAMGRSGRRRLHAEIGPDPDVEDQILVRFYVETANVPDLSLGAPREEDWEDSGQDGAYQELFAGRLAATLGLTPDPKAEGPLRFRPDGM